MTTTTIEVIFAGLMLLSQPEGDGRAVVAFPMDEEHQLKIFLLNGKATCGSTVIEADGTSELFPPADDSTLGLIYPGGEDRLYWVTGAIGTAPTDENKDYLAWLPSLSQMVLGDSRMPGDCRWADKSCPAAKSRFFVERGRVSTCHFVHERMSERKLQLFDLPRGVRRALADAFSVKETFEGDALELARGSTKCKLEPKSRTIQLFIAHAPPPPPHVHVSHFPRLHRLQRHFYQRMDQSAPKRAPQLEPRKHVDACEDAVATAHRAFSEVVAREAAKGIKLTPMMIHSPTECGGATQP